MRLRRATPLGPGVWGSQSRAGSALHKTLTLRVHTVMPISLRQGRACGGVCVCVCVCVRAQLQNVVPRAVPRGASACCVSAGVCSRVGSRRPRPPPCPCPWRPRPHPVPTAGGPAHTLSPAESCSSLSAQGQRSPEGVLEGQQQWGWARCGAPVSVDSCQPCFLGLAGMRDGGWTCF